MSAATQRVIVLILIAVLIASATLILYTKPFKKPQPGGVEEKPGEKPGEREEKPIVEEKPKGIGGERFGFVCFDEEAIEDLNLGWVRPHPGPFIWDKIEPTKGSYDFSKTDLYVQAAQEYGIQVVAHCHIRLMMMLV